MSEWMGSRGGVLRLCWGKGREEGEKSRGGGVLHAAKPFTPMGGRPARLDGAY